MVVLAVSGAAMRVARAVEIDLKRGSLDWVLALGGSAGVTAPSVASFKFLNDVDIMMSPRLAICPSLDIGLWSDVVIVGTAVGVKFRFPSFYAEGADIGIRVQATFDYLRVARETLFGVGVKVGPTFAWFATEKIGAAITVALRFGPIFASGKSAAVGFWIDVGLGLVFVL